MTTNTEKFDHWIRNEFAEMNTALEERYFAQTDDRVNVAGVGDDIKSALVTEGRDHIVRLLQEGNTDEGFEAGFDLLGNVGFYMAACRRHDITEPSRETTSPLHEASALALQLGASLGVAPRFVTAHLSTHNRAVDGISKSFTRLEDERIFNEYNTRSILGFKRAADALFRILPVGVTSPLAADLLTTAKAALDEVFANNAILNEKLDVDRFFLCVRPYFKPYRVGLHVYRGANAGDFAGINVIDLLLGLCRADEAYYSQLLVDKLLYMLPEDQLLLKDCMRRGSFLQELLAVPKQQARATYRHCARLFLDVCEVHGRIAAQHHDQLVKRFIEEPSRGINDEHLDTLTASGPPLPVLLRALEKLRDLRMAVERDDVRTSHRQIAQLRATLGG